MKSISKTLQGMIARPKISQNERKPADQGAFEVGNPFSRAASRWSSSRRRAARSRAAFWAAVSRGGWAGDVGAEASRGAGSGSAFSP
jgi:hypothetical protein